MNLCPTCNAPMTPKDAVICNSCALDLAAQASNDLAMLKVMTDALDALQALAKTDEHKVMLQEAIAKASEVEDLVDSVLCRICKGTDLTVESDLVRCNTCKAVAPLDALSQKKDADTLDFINGALASLEKIAATDEQRLMVAKTKAKAVVLGKLIKQPDLQGSIIKMMETLELTPAQRKIFDHLKAKHDEE